jgi:hypothetical protein
MNFLIERKHTMSLLTVIQGVRTVQLTRGYVALVDEADYPAVSPSHWQANLLRRGIVYAQRAIPLPKGPDGRYRQTSETMHRSLMNPGAEELVDHVNGDGLDNRRINLRICTRAGNMQNMRRTYGRSKYKGIVLSYNKWMVRIQSPDKVRVHLGYFKDEKDAARAYDRAAVEMFGEFAATNAMLFGDLDEDPGKTPS